MWNRIGRWIAPLAMALGALGGLAFAWSSTLDYSRHLDGQVHDLRCGFVPGLAAAPGADESCRAAIYSPYAALMRDRLWGGLPISLFAVGAFSFYAAFAIYLVVAGRGASRRAVTFLGVTALAPLAVSLLMAYLSATRIGTFCKTCMGIYFSSALLAIGALLALVAVRRETEEPARPAGASALVPGWLLALATFATMPALTYAKSAPSHDAIIGGCGKLVRPLAPGSDAAISVAFGRAAPGARTPVTLLVDPLCPSCRALHRRLDAEGYFEQMDTTVVLFPLDSACNWMVDRDVHPGACEVAKAMICTRAKGQSGALLEWAYDRQEEIVAAAKAQGAKSVDAMIDASFPGLGGCLGDKATAKTLDDMLRFAVDNHLSVSTPQLILGDQRMCDEDTDMGLVYALRRLAPQLHPRQF